MGLRKGEPSQLLPFRYDMIKFCLYFQTGYHRYQIYFISQYFSKKCQHPFSLQERNIMLSVLYVAVITRTNINKCVQTLMIMHYKLSSQTSILPLWILYRQKLWVVKKWNVTKSLYKIDWRKYFMWMKAFCHWSCLDSLPQLISFKSSATGDLFTYWLPPLYIVFLAMMYTQLEILHKSKQEEKLILLLMPINSSKLSSLWRKSYLIEAAKIEIL